MGIVERTVHGKGGAYDNVSTIRGRIFYTLVIKSEHQMRVAAVAAAWYIATAYGTL